MPVFRKSLALPVPVEALFAFHERPDALSLLSPPFPPVTMVQPPRSLEVRTVVIVDVGVAPFVQRMVVEHIAYEKNRLFVDRQVSGPFAFWDHRHIFESLGEGRSMLTDQVTFELPGGAIADLVGAPLVRLQLERLFAYRHTVTARELVR